MNLKRNYVLLTGIVVFLLGAFFIVIFLHPVEYLREKILKELIQRGGDVIPETDIPDNYYSEYQYNIDIEHYYVSLELEDDETGISGNVIIEGKSLTDKLDNIVLNFYDNMKISELKLNGMQTDFIHEKSRLSIPLNDNEEKFTLEIKYSGKPFSLYFGSFNISDYLGTPVVYTINEPTFASTWLPCNDLPTDKAIFDFEITADTSLTAISNGKFIKRETKGDKTTTTWKTIYPMSTYLAAVNIGKYENFSEVCHTKYGDVQIQYYVFPDQLTWAKSDFENHSKYINFFSDTFGEYPFIEEKYGIVEILWMSGAIENQTITGIGSPFITGDKKYEDLYVHELAHHWFGDAVTPSSWEDVWLNEGFATYCEALYIEHRDGNAALARFMSNKFDYFDHTKLYNPGIDLFSRLVYDKGAWVLHMLRNELGDDIFFDILRNYYQTYKYKNASTFDLKNLCEKMSGKNLDNFFNQWLIEGRGIIEAEYEIISKGAGYALRLSQIQTGYDVYSFPLEVEFWEGSKTADYKYFITTADTIINLDLDNYPERITFDPGTKLLAEFFPREKEK